MANDDDWSEHSTGSPSQVYVWKQSARYAADDLQYDPRDSIFPRQSAWQLGPAARELPSMAN